MAKKLPALMWYTGDWMKDPGVRTLTLAARGLWFDMLNLMHESARRGYLQHPSGKPILPAELARMTGSNAREVSRLLEDLNTSGVYSCTAAGVIYCRRMVRDEEIRKKRAECGKLGGNPALLLNQEDIHRDNLGDNQRPKQTPTPSYSVSISDSSSKEKAVSEIGIHEDGTQPDLGPLRDFMDLWNRTPGTIECRRMSHQSWRKLVDCLNDPGWRWREALARFPLAYFKRLGVGLPKFIENGTGREPHFVDAVLGGKYATAITEESHGKPKSGAYRPAVNEFANMPEETVSAGRSAG